MTSAYVAAGTVMLVVGGGVVFWWLFASPLARRGREYGYSPPSYTLVRTLQDRASRSHNLSLAEMEALRLLSSDRDWNIRVGALTALADLGSSDKAGSAAGIARSRLADKEGVVRQYALRALELLRAPDLKVAAKRLENDPDAWARGKARRILGYPPNQR
jgi:hypothetical protein